MSAFLLGLLIILLLVVLNGSLAMTELAIVSARKPRLQQMAAEGIRGAQTALRLAEEPGDFLSAVQIGITLIGILTGAFGGATLSAPVAHQLERVPLLEPVRRSTCHWPHGHADNLPVSRSGRTDSQADCAQQC